MANVTIQMPGVPDATMTIQNDKLDELARSYGVEPSAYKTQEEAVTELTKRIFRRIKWPLIKSREIKREAPSVDDVMTEA